jgi:hypothetical protein
MQLFWNQESTVHYQSIRDGKDFFSSPSIQSKICFRKYWIHTIVNVCVLSV